MGTIGTVKASVAGLGRIGWRHAADIRKTRGLALSALCETDAVLAEKAGKEFNVPVFTSYKTLLEQTDADFIVIATPSNLHFEMASRALMKKFNVLVEKPVTAGADGAVKLKSAAGKSGCWVSVNQSFRYRPDVVFIKNVIESGLIGKVYRIDLFQEGDFEARTDWQIWKKHDGGALLNWGVHLVDALLFITGGEPSDVFARLDTIIDKGDTEDVFKVTFKLDGGCVADAEVARSFFGKPQWYICGSRGNIYGEFSPPPVLRIQAKYLSGGKLRKKNKIIDFAKPPHTSQLLPHYSEIKRNLVKGMLPPVSIDSVIKTMKVLDAARKSSDKGASVTVKL